MEQILFKLPEGWECLTVKNLSTKVQYGYTTKANEKGNAKFLRITDIQNGEIHWNGVPFVSVSDKELAKYCLRTDDLVFARSGATSGKSILIANPPKNSIFASYLIRIVPDTKVVFPKFLELFFQSPEYWQQVSSSMSGAAQPNINGTKLSGFQVAIPPLDEQKCIVAKLDAIFTRIDTAIIHLQETLKLSKSLFASALDEAFQQAYSNCRVEILSKLTSKIGSGATPKGGQKSYKTEGISLIRSLNVHDAWFKKKNLAHIDDVQAGLLSNVEVKSGDVLLNITGASVARSCVVPDEYLPARVNQHVSILRPKDVLDPVFLNYLIISPNFKNDLLFQGAGGATRQALTKAMLQNLEIPLPSLNEQKHIVAHLDALSERTRILEVSTKEKLSDLTALKASLLDAAFRGQL